MSIETQTVRTFTINGKTVQAQPGDTVVQVAKREGIQIPVLCQHKALLPHSACRVCMVEAFWGKRSKLMASCVYEPCEGDVIETDNERVRTVRKMVLELLLARCPGVRQIQELATAYGAEKGVFREGPSDDAARRCILCGRCERVCREAIQQHAITYRSRGIKRKIVSPFEEPSPECIGCGACVFVCPTGALHSRDKGGKRYMQELNTELSMVPCDDCGTPFATERQRQRVVEKQIFDDGGPKRCPACRRAAFCDAIEDTMVDSEQRYTESEDMSCQKS